MFGVVTGVQGCWRLRTLDQSSIVRGAAQDQGYKAPPLVRDCGCFILKQLWGSPIGNPNPGSSSAPSLVALQVNLSGAPGFEAHHQPPPSPRRQSSVSCRHPPAPQPVWTHAVFPPLQLSPPHHQVLHRHPGTQPETWSSDENRPSREPQGGQGGVNTGCTIRMCTKSLQGGNGVVGPHTKGSPVFCDAHGDISRYSRLTRGLGFGVTLLLLGKCVVSTEPWAGPGDGIWGFIILFIFTNDEITKIVKNYGMVALTQESDVLDAGPGKLSYTGKNYLQENVLHS